MDGLSRHATARLALGLSDRTLAVLDALLTFHPETALSLDGGPALVVYPSNAALGLRAHGLLDETAHAQARPVQCARRVRLDVAEAGLGALALRPHRLDHRRWRVIAATRDQLFGRQS